MLRGLDAFRDQFAAQVVNAGPPASEHAVHFCIALGFQTALNLPPGSFIFEAPYRGGRTDLRFLAPLDLCIEVKYQRPIPSGRIRPYPQLYGSLLADFNKVADVGAAVSLVVLVADAASLGYIRRSGGGLLPLDVDRRTVSGPTLADLPQRSPRSWTVAPPASPVGVDLGRR